MCSHNTNQHFIKCAHAVRTSMHVKRACSTKVIELCAKNRCVWRAFQSVLCKLLLIFDVKIGTIWQFFEFQNSYKMATSTHFLLILGGFVSKCLTFSDLLFFLLSNTLKYWQSIKLWLLSFPFHKRHQHTHPFRVRSLDWNGNEWKCIHLSMDEIWDTDVIDCIWWNVRYLAPKKSAVKTHQKNAIQCATIECDLKIWWNKCLSH